MILNKLSKLIYSICIIAFSPKIIDNKTSHLNHVFYEANYAAYVLAGMGYNVVNVILDF